MGTRKKAEQKSTTLTPWIPDPLNSSSDGTTLARQLKTEQEITKEQNLEFVKMIDSGISAFKGKNA